MALQTVGTTSIGAGVRMNLGNTDHAYVARGALVSSSDNDAITGSGGNQRFTIDGTVAALYAAISGTGSASLVNGYRVLISETGMLYCINGVGVGLLGYNNLVENKGTISSGFIGVYLNGISATTTSKVLNSGRIEADQYGISRPLGATERLEVVNSGTIKADGYSLHFASSPSVEHVTNVSKIVGSIVLGGGDDVYEGTNGRLTGTILAGNGNDTLRGGKDNDTFYGEAGNDKLFGGSGNDRLDGGTGKDKLTGGIGADILTGGADADTFIFTSIKDSTVATSGRDTIMDFKRGQGDKIDLKAIDANTKAAGDQAFKFIKTAAFSKTAGELRYEQKSGKTIVYGDVDGDGKADFSIMLDTKVALVAGDFVL